MPLTLSDIATAPHLLTFEIILPNKEEMTFRPLEPHDVKILTEFLEGLSAHTRAFYVFDSYDRHTAQEMCDAINRYDKLRFLVIHKSTGKVIALFEYSFDIPDGDIQRFSGYRVALDSHIDCRFGPCIADELQNRGIGSALFPYCVEVARKFEKERIILWGGVLSSNKRAIKFYEKHGFEKLGIFKNKDGNEAVDMIMNLTQIA